MAARALFPANVLLANLLGKKQGVTTEVLIYLPFLQIYSKNDLKNIPSLKKEIAATGIRSTPYLGFFFFFFFYYRLLKEQPETKFATQYFVEMPAWWDVCV